MSYTYCKLKDKISEIYGSQKRFSEAIGLAETSVSQRLSGQIPFSKEEMETWGNCLGIKATDFLSYFFA